MIFGLFALGILYFFKFKRDTVNKIIPAKSEKDEPQTPETALSLFQQTTDVKCSPCSPSPIPLTERKLIKEKIIMDVEE